MRLYNQPGIVERYQPQEVKYMTVKGTKRPATLKFPVSMPVEMADKLMEIAATKGQYRSSYIRYLITVGLKHDGY
jgi:hypothetical protein